MARSSGSGDGTDNGSGREHGGNSSPNDVTMAAAGTRNGARGDAVPPPPAPIAAAPIIPGAQAFALQATAAGNSDGAQGGSLAASSPASSPSPSSTPLPSSPSLSSPPPWPTIPTSRPTRSDFGTPHAAAPQGALAPRGAGGDGAPSPAAGSQASVNSSSASPSKPTKRVSAGDGGDRKRDIYIGVAAIAAIALLMVCCLGACTILRTSCQRSADRKSQSAVRSVTVSAIVARGPYAALVWTGSVAPCVRSQCRSWPWVLLQAHECTKLGPGSTLVTAAARLQMAKIRSAQAAALMWPPGSSAWSWVARSCDASSVYIFPGSQEVFDRHNVRLLTLIVRCGMQFFVVWECSWRTCFALDRMHKPSDRQHSCPYCLTAGAPPATQR